MSRAEILAGWYLVCALVLAGVALAVMWSWWTVGGWQYLVFALGCSAISQVFKRTAVALMGR